jgi:4-hydroxybutyrate CoA-transferase
MAWEDEYKRKFIPVEEAIKNVKSGDRVAFAQGGATPRALALALAARRNELKEVELIIPTPTEEFEWLDPSYSDSFKLSLSMATLPAARKLIDSHRCDLYGMPPFSPVIQEKLPPQNIDVLMIEVSPPNKNGYCSFGAARFNKKEEIRQAKIAIAEVNDRFIRTYGDNFIHLSEIDWFVPHVSSGRIPGARGTRAGATELPLPELKPIAEYVASLIKDGDTIEVGVGGTSAPLPQLGIFENKHDLGWHSEATPRGIAQLVQAGVITGKYKTLHPGKIVATSVGGGNPEDLDFIHENPLFELYSIDYVDDIRTIAAHDNMVAINSALAVDFIGQIAAETLGERIFMSGPGGQPPFAIGAVLSRGGRSITVLPSTAANGTASRIVPKLDPGTVVTVPRVFADYIVTEYGIARLLGKSQRQKTEELIAIAHPDFRAELKSEAQRMYWP